MIELANNCTLRASDPSGAYSLQSFTLAVGARKSNGSNLFVSFDNRLVGYVRAASNGSVEISATYRFDAIGRRISKSVTSSDGTTETIGYRYDGLDTWKDVDASGATTARYMPGDRIDELTGRHRVDTGLGEDPGGKILGTHHFLLVEAGAYRGIDDGDTGDRTFLTRSGFSLHSGQSMCSIVQCIPRTEEMARIARCEVFHPDEIAIVHVVNRTVRRCFLMGDDPVTGNNYDHRKKWLEDQLIRQAAYFGVDLLCQAILDNHYHLVLRSRPDVVLQWDDSEVARRWMLLCPLRKDSDGNALEPNKFELNSIRNNQERLAEIRSRLSDISWWMRLLSQNIAQRANREDQEVGKFWNCPISCVAPLRSTKLALVSDFACAA